MAEKKSGGSWLPSDQESLLRDVIAAVVKSSCPSPAKVLTIGEALMSSQYYCEEARTATLQMFRKQVHHSATDLMAMALALLEEANAVLLAIQAPETMICSITEVAKVLRTNPGARQKTEELSLILIKQLQAIDEENRVQSENIDKKVPN